MLNIFRNAVISTLKEMAVRLVQEAWDAPITSCSIGSLKVGLQAYQQFNPAVIQFQALSQQSDGLLLRKQEETLFAAGPPLHGPDGCVATARHRSAEVDAETLFLLYSVLKNLKDVTSNISLYSTITHCHQRVD